MRRIADIIRGLMLVIEGMVTYAQVLQELRGFEVVRGSKLPQNP